MGQDQSVPDGQTEKSNPLSSFCCNTNLCNNDSNIDNRNTEAGRRAAGRNILTAG